MRLVAAIFLSLVLAVLPAGPVLAAAQASPCCKCACCLQSGDTSPTPPLTPQSSAPTLSIDHSAITNNNLASAWQLDPLDPSDLTTSLPVARQPLSLFRRDCALLL